MKVIVTAILNFLTAMISGVFSPISSLIHGILPSNLNVGLTMFLNFLNWLSDFVKFVLSWLPFTSEFWAFFISVIIFKITLSVSLDIIKLVVKWWHALAP